MRSASHCTIHQAWKAVSWRRRHQYQFGRCICEAHPTLLTCTVLHRIRMFPSWSSLSMVLPSTPPLFLCCSRSCGAKNASDLLPSGSIYGLERNKSVELTIPGGALGGPVSSVLLVISDLVPDWRLCSIRFTCTDMPSPWSVAPATHPTIS